MKTRNYHSLESAEQVLLERLIDNKVTISRIELADAANIGRRTVSDVNARLTTSGRWRVDVGGGRSETTYTYLGK